MKLLPRKRVIIVGTSNLPGEVANSASMLYSNNMTTFTSLADEGKVVLSEDDDILVGAPEGSDFYVMNGSSICSVGNSSKATRLKEALN